MYPSGRWDGFWVQDGWGRQAMAPLILQFAHGHVTGQGRDRVGVFTFHGDYNELTGEVRMIKQYLGQHRVVYVGQPDGEGSIIGRWSIGELQTGPFLLRPQLPQPTGTEPIHDIG
ncbi:MAG: hypothetical protein RMJ56_09135 [Gemmataceae bacterium]|nr:hypothetical protein [Gemmata sp.]MDW8197751.1 hypothetical protein [Gemmataceae bacterium]